MEYKGRYQTIDGVVHIWDKATSSYIKREDAPKNEKKATVSKKENVAKVENAIDIAALTKQITEQVKASLVEDKGFSTTMSNSVKVEMSARELKSTDIPDDDLMETPKTFYAYNASLGILGDVDRGKTIPCPYNMPIYFKQIASERTRTGEGKIKETPRCCVEVWSKKVCEFLLKHRWYRNVYFDSLEGLQRVDKSTLTFRMAALAEVGALNQREVAIQCRNFNIAIDSDFDIMRSRLIEKKIELNSGFLLKQQEDIAIRNINQQLLNPTAPV